MAMLMLIYCDVLSVRGKAISEGPGCCSLEYSWPLCPGLNSAQSTQTFGYLDFLEAPMAHFPGSLILHVADTHTCFCVTSHSYVIV